MDIIKKITFFTFLLLSSFAYSQEGLLVDVDCMINDSPLNVVIKSSRNIVGIQINNVVEETILLDQIMLFFEPTFEQQKQIINNGYNIIYTEPVEKKYIFSKSHEMIIDILIDREIPEFKIIEWDEKIEVIENAFTLILDMDCIEN